MPMAVDDGHALEAAQLAIGGLRAGLGVQEQVAPQGGDVQNVRRMAGAGEQRKFTGSSNPGSVVPPAG